VAVCVRHVAAATFWTMLQTLANCVVMLHHHVNTAVVRMVMNVSCVNHCIICHFNNNALCATHVPMKSWLGRVAIHRMLFVRWWRVMPRIAAASALPRDSDRNVVVLVMVNTPALLVKQRALNALDLL